MRCVPACLGAFEHRSKPNKPPPVARTIQDGQSSDKVATATAIADSGSFDSTAETAQLEALQSQALEDTGTLAAVSQMAEKVRANAPEQESTMAGQAWKDKMTYISAGWTGYLLKTGEVSPRPPSHGGHLS